MPDFWQHVLKKKRGINRIEATDTNDELFKRVKIENQNEM